jgi:hypothetical protein
MKRRMELDVEEEEIADYRERQRLGYSVLPAPRQQGYSWKNPAWNGCKCRSVPACPLKIRQPT